MTDCQNHDDPSSDPVLATSESVHELYPDSQPCEHKLCEIFLCVKLQLDGMIVGTQTSIVMLLEIGIYHVPLCHIAYNVIGTHK